MQERIAVVGLGYVGLPVAVALAERFPGVIGFDISERRVSELAKGHDRTGEVSRETLENSSLDLTVDPDRLATASFIIVTVPTPIDAENRPDLDPLAGACRTIATRMGKGTLVVFESTVYPGVTEDFCAPLLETGSALRRSRDFTVGYSPERINPGDAEHRLATVTKIIAAEDAASLERMRAVYGAIVPAGLHVAPSIKVAEAAKVIENTQRDLNVALMNEASLIFDLMGIDTSDVLAAAATKWNFLPFRPGLVGGHCMGVDPYYLTSAAELHGYHPDVILAGRRVNDGMAAHIARKTIKLLVRAGHLPHDARVGVLGLTFKENVPDLRNSKVADIVRELGGYGVDALVHDPHADRDEAAGEYGITLRNLEELRDLHALILAVPHRAYLADPASIVARVIEGGIVIDVKGALPWRSDEAERTYWSL